MAWWVAWSGLFEVTQLDFYLTRPNIMALMETDLSRLAIRITIWIPSGSVDPKWQSDRENVPREYFSRFIALFLTFYRTRLSTKCEHEYITLQV